MMNEQEIKEYNKQVAINWLRREADRKHKEQEQRTKRIIFRLIITSGNKNK